MKYCLIWGGILFCALILQSTLLPLLAYQGIHGDLLLILVVLTSLHLGKKQGALIGFSAGLLQDLSSGTFFGMNTFSKLLLAYLFGMAERKVFKEHIILPIITAIVATVGNYLITAMIMALLGHRLNLIDNAVTMVVPLLVYNVILSLPLHKLVWKIHMMAKENNR